MSPRRVVGTVVALAAGLLCAVVYATYQRDLQNARQRITIGSRIAETSCGPVEYAIAEGRRETILVVHGAGGGYDQGLDLADALIRKGFRVVAVSRFGYLRTPLPREASAMAQADAFACLLDTLQIQHAVVLGASAGGPSSLQFALRYPQRVDALILLVPAAYPAAANRRSSPAQRWMLNTSLRSDFFFWLAMHLAPRTIMQAVLGTPPTVLEQASADERMRIARVLEHILPISPRRPGLLNDAAVVGALPRYALEQIRVPTLVVSSRDDGYGTYDGSSYTAQHIAGARFVGYKSGGHMLIGHQQEVRAAIERLLEAAR